VPGPTIDPRAGFVPQAYDEVLAERRARLSDPDMLGPGFDLDSPGEPIPALVRVGGEREALVQLKLAELATGLRRGVSTGALLEAGAGLSGLERIAPRPSRVPGILRGSPGADASLKLWRFRRTGTLWRAPEGSVVGPDGTLALELESTLDGPTPAYAAGTDEWGKASAAPDLASFESTAPARLGRWEETDPELRERVRVGPAIAGTEPAYYRRLYELTGHGRVVVFNNRTNQIDSKGVKGKHVEVLIEGAGDEEVALAIFRAASGDTGFQGNERVTPLALDEAGDPYPRQPIVYFSRPEARRAYVRLELDTAGAEVPLPPGYAGTARGAVAQRRQIAGRDLLRGPFEALVTQALPDGCTSQVIVRFRWSPVDAWSSPTLAVGARERAEIFAGPAPAIVECDPGPYAISPGWHLDITTPDGSKAAAIPDGAYTSGALAKALTAAAFPGMAFGQRAGRLVLRSTRAGALAGFAIEASSSAGLLFELGIASGPRLGSDSDVEVAVL
jgi:hypothetical protein